VSEQKIYQYKLRIGLSFLKKLAPFFLLLTACANQGMPPGGPVDKSPPQVVMTIPAHNSTSVDRRTKVEVVFNEWLNSRTVEDAVFISPYVGEDVKIKKGGKKVKIIFPHLLKKECTYVITFGTGIKDLHNNGLEKSFTLAFSTGDVLDKGEIKGKVYEKGDVKGIDVWAYLLKEDEEINPSVLEPDYIIQCESDGDFHFTHISTGKYRLFAIKDRIADRLYTIGEDRVGLTYGDVVISKEKFQIVDSLFFRMFLQDTLGPTLVRAVPVNRHLFKLLFDQPVCLDELHQENIKIFSIQDSLNILKIYKYFIDPNDNKSIQVLTESQREETYSVRVKGIVDESGNPVDPEFNTFMFNAILQTDTVKPQLSKISPRPGEKDVYHKKDIHLIFNESIDTVTFSKGFSLVDTLTGSISGVFKWFNPAEVSFILKNSFDSQTVYRVTLSGEWIKDLSGNSLNDTLYYFKTLNKDTLSGISGRIINPNMLEKSNVYVTLTQTENEEIFYRQKMDSSGDFNFKQIIPGNYIISCFCDRDLNGVYSYGNPFPFIEAERLIVFSDTVLAKSRWPNAENNIKLPSYLHSQD